MTTEFTPPGHNRVCPFLLVPSARATLDFFKFVFEGVEPCCIAAADGSVKHAEARIGDSVVMIGERTALTGLSGSVHVYVPNVDETYRRALDAGATSISEPRDMPYGDRSAGVRDGQGNLWWLGTHLHAT